MTARGSGIPTSWHAGLRVAFNRAPSRRPRGTESDRRAATRHRPVGTAAMERPAGRPRAVCGDQRKFGDTRPWPTCSVLKSSSVGPLRDLHEIEEELVEAATRACCRPASLFSDPSGLDPPAGGLPVHANVEGDVRCRRHRRRRSDRLSTGGHPRAGRHPVPTTGHAAFKKGDDDQTPPPPSTSPWARLSTALREEGVDARSLSARWPTARRLFLTPGDVHAATP